MTLTEFLTKHARHKFMSVKELAQIAKKEKWLKPGETQKVFCDLLSIWMTKRRDGVMGNGFVFYTELPFKNYKLTARCGDKNVALIRIGRPMK